MGAQSPAGKLWFDLEAKRNKLGGFHQEFDVSRTFILANENQSATWQAIVDMHGTSWRERHLSGSCNCVTIFDGHDLLEMQEEGDEYARTKPKSKVNPLPTPYTVAEPDWSKAVELERRPCAPPVINDECVLIRVPIQPRSISFVSPSQRTNGLGGTEQLLINTVNGALILARSIEAAQNHSQSYQIDISYMMAGMKGLTSTDEVLFALPTKYTREVRDFKPWDATTLRKQLVGHEAPELAVKYMQGKSITLASLRGKTVLLDFWATWCAPCRADGPALDKLSLKYRDKGLEVVGISVSEEREIVEKYLKETPSSHPIVLTSENEMPGVYRVGAFPTYIVIDPDGAVSSIVSGDKSFYELLGLLKKAGLETD